MQKFRSGTLLVGLLLLSLTGCDQSVSGRINFSLEGGTFTDPSFGTTYLQGTAGTPVLTNIPTPVKEGYYFVGWREKTSNGSYRTIHKRQYEDGNYYYYYPYGNDTFYAYFEPLVTLSFDLTQGSEEGTLIAPKFDDSNFSDGKLSGYASKDIASADYLPTADATSMHLNFEYWYTKYPLVEETDETHTEHYRLDSTQKEGVYRFDQSFSSGMVFPIDAEVTLYAYWSKDPTITINYNIDGFARESFQAKDSISEELTSLMKEKFAIDFSLPATHYYYIRGDINKRFAGFFLDAEFKDKFFLDSPIASNDFTLYLKWENKVNVTLDYNGGSLNGETEHQLTDYYEGDTLTNEVYTQFIPTSDLGSFSHYRWNSETFSFTNTVLPGYDITLYAEYDNYPVLTLTVDYPLDYDGTRAEDEIYYLPVGEDITSYISNFKSTVNDSSLEFEKIYRLEQGEELSCPKTMPIEDLTIYYQFDYLAQVNIKTIANADGNYTIQQDVQAYETTFSKDSNGIPQEISLNSFSGIEDSIILSDRTYLFDGIYSDVSGQTEARFPLYQEASHTQQVTIQLYRKMSKAILLSFYSYTEDSPFLGQLYVLPGANTDDYQDQFASLLGSFDNLYLQQGSTMVALGSTLPLEDSTVYVSR